MSEGATEAGESRQCLRHEGSQSCRSTEGMGGGGSFVYVL